MNNTFNYPTLAEAYKTAALDVWNRMAAHVREEDSVRPPTELAVANG